MRWPAPRLLLLLLAVLLPSLAGAADPAGGAAPATGPVEVGVFAAPPFAMQEAGGQWTGIAVELWEHVARDLGITYVFRELSVPDLVGGLEQGALTSVITAAASADRELLIDFSHPYYSSGVAIAVPVQAGAGGWLQPLANLATRATLRLTLVLLALTVLAATLIWLFEHRSNPEHFARSPTAGLADGLWWAMVTLTTVGYGDKAPRTGAGRLVAVVWMLMAVVLIALFTAQVTSSLTVTSLAGRVRGPADLPSVRVGALQDSQQQAVLRVKLGVTAKGYPSFGAGLDALARDEIDAFVGPEPILRYEIANAYTGRLTVVGAPFLRIDYVFALPLGSPLRKPVNQSILAFIETDAWRQLLRTYLGGDGS